MELSIITFENAKKNTIKSKKTAHSYIMTHYDTLNH